MKGNVLTVFASINLHSHWNVIVPTFGMETNTSSEDRNIRSEEMLDDCGAVAITKENLRLIAIKR